MNYNTDYDVTVDSDEDGIHLYQGPGEKYGAVPGTEEIKNGETLHIVQEAEMVDGSRWGVTDSLEKDGWVNLDETREGKDTGIQKEDVDGKNGTGYGRNTGNNRWSRNLVCRHFKTSGSGREGGTDRAAEEKTEPTKAAEAEEKAELTEAAEEKVEPTKAAEAEEKVELTEAPEAEEKAEEKDEEMAQEETAGNERKAEPTETPGAADAASREVQTDTAPSGVPLVFIILAAVAAVGGLFIYHFRKR